MDPYPCGCSSRRNAPRFSIPIILGDFNMRLPKVFYESKKNEIKNEVQLTDPMGNCLKMKVVVGPSGGILFEAIPILVSFYGLEKDHDMVFIHQGGNRFKVEIYDENRKHFPYPNHSEKGKNKTPTVSPSPNPPTPEVIYLSSDNEEEVVAVAEEEVVAAEEVAAPGQAQNGIQTFEKNVTSSLAGGGQTVALPRSYVRGHLRENWQSVLLKNEGDEEWYICKLCWRKRNGRITDCHLGDGFYKFVTDNSLAEHDRLFFRTVNGSNNILHVRIERHNGNGANGN